MIFLNLIKFSDHQDFNLLINLNFEIDFSIAIYNIFCKFNAAVFNSLY